MSHDRRTGTTATTRSKRRSRWPLYGVAAGALGAVATLLTDGRAPGPADLTNFLEPLNRHIYHASIVAGYLTVVLLMILAAVWRRHVEPRVPQSTAARVVAGGLTAAAGALTLGYGWKGAMAIYLPGGPDAALFDRTGLYVYYVLNDFGSFIGWLGVTTAAGAIAWMALRERTISRWIGVLSLLPVLEVTGFVALGGLPGAPGLSTPAWLAIAFAGLAFGRSTISR